VAGKGWNHVEADDPLAQPRQSVGEDELVFHQQVGEPGNNNNVSCEHTTAAATTQECNSSSSSKEG
jgi:hypothetical protein